MMAQHEWQEGTVPLGLYFSFLTKRFVSAMVERLAHVGLEKYFITLVIVEQSNESFTQQNLADYFKINKASMVRIIDYLTKKGFLKRKKNLKDRREHLLILTEKAKKALPEIKNILKELDQVALKGFTTDQKMQFFYSLEQVYVNMSEQPSEDIFLNVKKATGTKLKQRQELVYKQALVNK